MGESLDFTNEKISPETVFMVQDVSPVVGLKASFQPEDASFDWTVVAACADDEHIEKASEVEIAIIPHSSVNQEVRAQIQKGEWLRYVTCDGLEYH